MRATDRRLRGWRRVASTVVVLVLLAVAAAILVLLFAARGDVETGPTQPLGPGFGVFYHCGMLAGAVSCVIAGAIVLRGAGRAYSHALALSLAAGTVAALLILSIFISSGDDAAPAYRLLAAALPVAPPLLVVAVGGFLRFAVLFPRPLTPQEIGRLSQVKPGDSLDRMDRVAARVGGRLVPGGSKAAASLLERVPRPVRRVAQLDVVPDSGRLLTEPKRLWSLVAVVAAAPALLWAGLEWLPDSLGVSLSSSAPPAWVGIGLYVLLLALIGLGLLLGAAVLRTGYALADTADRRRMRWIVEGLNSAVWVSVAIAPFWLLTAAGVDNPVVDLFPALFMGIVPLIVLTGFALAVFYDGALEPALVVRKSNLYGLFGLGVAFGFALLEELITEHLTARLGLPDGTGALAASGIVAVVFGSLFRRFSRKVDDYVSSTASEPAAQLPEPAIDD